MGTTIAGACLECVIAGESAICYFDGYQGIPGYCGFSIRSPADNAVFEEVIFLLWNGCDGRPCGDSWPGAVKLSPIGDSAEVPFTRANKGAAVHLCAPQAL